MAEWRVDGIVGKGLYRDGVPVGWADTAEIAREIVETMNRVGRLLDEVRSVIGRQVCGACLNEADVLSARRLDRHLDNGGMHCAGSGRVAERPVQACPPDAQRRSEATPKNDLDLLGPSRVDPYDTTKGGVAES